MAPQTACFIVIGNEILSGRTQDANTVVLAHALNCQGIKLEETRTIPDIRERIISTLNECRTRFDFIFTSGGIGPTHDDITSSSIADALGLPLTCHEETFTLLEKCFEPGSFNKARQRMAWFPQGAEPIKSDISVAPGFSIKNIYVMAGVPSIFHSMVNWLVPRLPKGKPLQSLSWYGFNVYESSIAEPLTKLQEEYPTLDLGSYPFEKGEKKGVALVAKGYDAQSVQEAGKRIKLILQNIKATPFEGDP
ncbi:competence/damage-inducible protein A [Aristophania vespae]|uniref:Competence/damage-inducible protein A n=1 Tax=Aristophania vespae TaxID=2697033 RepID=A0A6P1NFU2_9PROT|nr:competence/damage-inducible protein A [Aristophania vespae]QHI95324.1 competence/damage-inducible protein A [Aristophania vespae]UMM64583.1 Putative competence-damage inducible protein [Aristophania vespae]